MATPDKAPRPRRRSRFLLATGLLLLIGVAVAGGWLAIVLKGTPSSVNTMATRQFIQYMATDPETLTLLGFIDGRIIDRHSSRLYPRTQEELDRRTELVRRFRAELDRYDPDRLSDEDLLTYQVWGSWLDDEIAAAEPFFSAPLALSSYVISQYGLHTSFWALMTGAHQPTNRRLARNYIRRLQAFEQAATEVVELFEAHAARDILPPRSILERVATSLDEKLAVAPEESDLVTSMRTRMETSGAFSSARVDEFTAQATAAVATHVYPGLERIRGAVEDHMDRARTTEIGVIGLPGGAEYYRARIRQNTTLNLDPGELHREARAEFDRLLGELDRALMDQGQVEGTIAERFDRLRAETFYPVAEGDAGREELLAIANDWLDRAREEFRPYFGRFPEADVEIRLATGATVGSLPNRYAPPAADGSRPGVFWMAIEEPTEISSLYLPRLVIHETIPGHHHHLALQQEMGLPLIRQHLPFAGFAEGWATYIEGMAREVGFFDEDEIAEIGAIRELLSWVALVVLDTGLHHEGWSREEALDFISNMAVDPEASGVAMDHILVLPGQILSYHIGSEHIRNLRGEAQAALGEAFDLAAFHDAVLSAGSLPLDLLTQRIREWIAEQVE